MDTMIITTDNQTITRMAVIAKRTDSEFMAGAKAMMWPTSCIRRKTES